MRCLLLLFLLMPSAVSMRPRTPTAETRNTPPPTDEFVNTPPPSAHSLLDASMYNVAQAAVPKWLIALLGPLALMGGARADLLHPAEGALHNAGLMYNVEMLHNMPPTTGSPAYEANIKEWEGIARLPDAQQRDAIQYWQPSHVDPPKYTVSTEGQKLNQKFFEAFEAMAGEVVHNDLVTYSNKATPAEMSRSVTASMDQVDKYLSFLEEPERRGDKEFFQTDWSKRATGSHERKERQTQVEFVVNVAENTLAHFSDAHNLRAGELSKNLEAQMQAMKSLRNLRRLVELVLVENHLNPTGYKLLEGPEKDILDKIDKLLVTLAEFGRLSTSK